MTVETNADPRNYYRDQYQRHLKRPNEIADLVIRIPDAYYDIGLLKQADGTYSWHFDAYGYKGHTGTGTKPLKAILGQPFAGREGHWAGEQTNREDSRFAIGKLLAEYTLCATQEILEAQGMLVESLTFDETGAIQLVAAQS